MKDKLLYIHIGKSTFVKKDIEILNTQFEVIEFHFNINKKHLLPLEFLKEFLFICKHFRVKKVVSQFGGFHTVLPSFIGKIFQQKHAIILSGTDCVSFPSINYGNFNRKFLGFATKISLKKANLLLPVSEELVKYKYAYQSNDFPFQGYQFHAPKVTTKYSIINYGYNPDVWQAYYPKEENSFITVAANLSSRFGVQLKGIDLLIETALKLPSCQFYIVGGKTIHESIRIPENVHLIENIPNEKLKQFVGSKQYYLQLSMSEGFPNALCEAMLCECIPIVSNVSSMPYIVDASGLVLPQKDSNLLKDLILKALKEENKTQKGLEARQRIVEHFSLEKRSEKLLKEIKNF